MPTTIIIDGVTLTLKKYPEFVAGTPSGTDITLFANPVSGDLFKTTGDELIANLLNVDGVTITGDGSSGSPLVAAASGSATADNGLHIDGGSGDVYLGGTLLEATTITGNDKDFIIDNSRSTFSYALQVLNGNPSGAGGIYTTGQTFGIKAQGGNLGVYGIAPNYGVVGESTATGGSGIGVQGLTIDGLAFLAQAESSIGTGVQTLINIVRHFASPSNGMGSSIDFQLTASDNTVNVSNQIISKYIDVTVGTRTSEFKFTGVLSGSAVDLITLNADGSWQIRPITATAASAITPAEGMLLFVSNTNGTFTSIGPWMYYNGAWNAL